MGRSDLCLICGIAPDAHVEVVTHIYAAPQHPILLKDQKSFFALDLIRMDDVELMTHIQDDLTQGIRDAEEARLLDFFGSIENAEKYGKYFILENTPTEIFQDYNIDDNCYKFSIEHESRLRPKTIEELTADGL